MRFKDLLKGVALASVLIGFAAAQDLATLNPNSPDPWLWLADIHGAKPLAWVKEQDARTLAALKSDLQYKQDHDAILKVLNANDRIPLPVIEHGIVYNFWQDADHVRGLWRRTAAADYAQHDPHWDLLLDIDALDRREGKNWVWSGAQCAPDNRHCLVRLSPGGSDAVAVREFDQQRRAFIAGGFALSVAKSDMAYVDNDTILFGTDFGPGSMTKSSYPRIVKLWHRGEPISAAKTVYAAKTSDIAARPMVFRGPYGTIALIERGITFFTSEFYAVDKSGATRKLPLPAGANVKGVTGGQLIFMARDDWTPPDGKTIAKGSLVAFNVQDFADRNAKPSYAVLFTPDARGAIEDVSPGRDAVYAAIFENVTGAIHAFTRNPSGAWNDTPLELPKGGSTHVVDSDAWTPEAYFTFESFLQPVTLYSYDGTGAPRALKSEPARFDASGLASEQFEATSADGTKIPYFFIHAKDARGTQPTILYSYGGFELSLEPWYWNDGHRPLDTGQTWLTKGGAIAVANIRGGGEFGPKWHDAALKMHRQRAYDDFEAVAADIERRGFASPQQLGSVGASNGGLLVTATMVERPRLFGAVVCQRPLIDMLRYTHYGAGASWVGEYGDPAEPKMRAAILKYSPYENLKPGVKYPPVLFITETSDDRVTPVFARMMAAKMESMHQDVMFYESLEGGHGPGATHEEQAEMWALSFAYFAQKLGLHAPATQ
ncbi:MAG TPA: prolyl oligopeptidase family serine peptidase [Rhizomicrobium sp.]|jgi:prolyl oligopeptidase|nr:prolyl oligopeptidase family serine peptidase [Rhizomicrobium sp.]